MKKKKTMNEALKIFIQYIEQIRTLILSNINGFEEEEKTHSNPSKVLSKARFKNNMHAGTFLLHNLVCVEMLR